MTQVFRVSLAAASAGDCIPGSFPAGWPRRTLPTYSLAPYASAPLARAALHTLPRLFRFPDMALLGISNWVALSNYDC